MPGWLWVVVVVALAVIIYLLLRGRAGGGRHRAPAAEYAPPLEEGTGPVDAETGFGPAATAGLTGPAAAPVAAVDDDGADRRWAPQGVRETREEPRETQQEPRETQQEPRETREEPREAREEELAEDAELRHDEGYVETLDDPAPTAEPDPEPEPERVTPGAVTPSEYGAGSAAPTAGGGGPQGWTVKGNADSLLYYTADAPGFARAAADVWFENEEAATKAGFTRWDAHHR